MLLRFLIILVIFIISSINCFETTQNFYIDDFDETNDQCTTDQIIAKLLDIFTPDDYEEGKENIKSEIESLNQTLKAVNRLQEYSRNVSQKLSDFNRRLSNRFSEALMTVNLPTDCMRSLVRIINAAKNGEIWALRFFEAQPRPTNGITEGTGLPYGNYDQCLAIESPSDEKNPKIIGQYCGVSLETYFVLTPDQFTPELHEQFKFDTYSLKILNQTYSQSIRTFYKRTYSDWLTVFGFLDTSMQRQTKLINGLCLPSTCSPNDVSIVVNELTFPITRIPFKLSDDCSYIGKPVRLNNYQIISIIGLGSVFVVFLLCSIIDFLPKTYLISKSVDKSFLKFYVKCFSVKRNAKSIFSLKQYGKFKALDGFRAILTFYVVLLHTYEIGIMGFFNRNHYLSGSYKMTMDYRNMFLPNILLMDNFLLISGFLLGNTILSKLEQSKGKFNYIQYIIFKYLRVMPIIVCGLFCTYLFQLIGDGPLWDIVELYFVKPCYERWYKPLLMFNNFLYYPNENSTVQSSVQCLTISWYASMDFQLFALSPISFLLLYKSPKYGVLCNLALLLFTIFLPVFNKVVLGLPHVYEVFTEPDINKVMSGFAISYWGPINYMQTYIIGILVAYAVRRRPDVYLGGRIGELFIWLITASMSFGLLYWQRNFIIPGYPFEAINGLEMPIYLLTHKWVYCSGFAWLIFACATDRGGFVNEILGWKGFKVIDNLALEIYIMHTFAFMYRMGVNRDQRTYTDYYIWTSSVFDLVASYMVSVIVALVITRPFANMTIALLKPKQKMTVKDDNDVKGKSNSDKTVFPILQAKDITQLNVIHYTTDKIVYRL